MSSYSRRSCCTSRLKSAVLISVSFCKLMFCGDSYHGIISIQGDNDTCGRCLLVNLHRISVLSFLLYIKEARKLLNPQQFSGFLRSHESSSLVTTSICLNLLFLYSLYHKSRKSIDAVNQYTILIIFFIFQLLHDSLTGSFHRWSINRGFPR